ncbi:hypothetical protein ROZALSC1DRAFT_25254 [Rozella allomycis CSF55]|uniref:Uncharacterized protein n=1 Tax=Rozella allomycis (strain CSF55) TaxID=988480 RepID=A0A4P9YB37_ROZAC|nr:hypothetical protein ROZALSC1DRAFT_25254 [Rozella allomycis CSF55]
MENQPANNISAPLAPRSPLIATLGMISLKYQVIDSICNVASTSAPADGQQASDVWKIFTLEKNGTMPKARSALRCLSVIQRRRRISYVTYTSGHNINCERVQAGKMTLCLTFAKNAQNEF